MEKPGHIIPRAPEPARPNSAAGSSGRLSAASRDSGTCRARAGCREGHLGVKVAARTRKQHSRLAACQQQVAATSRLPSKPTFV